MSQKNKKGGFFRSLLGILGASLGEVELQQAKEQLEQLKKNLIQPHPLTNFEIQKHYQKEPKFNGVYSRNNLSKIKDGAFIINLDDYESIGTHWITLYVNYNNETYFDSFRVEHIPEEIRKFLGNKYVPTNIYRIKAYDLIMCGYFYFEFIDFMLKAKSLLEHTISPNDYKKEW